MDKVAELVKLARQISNEERNRKARARYRSGGAQVRRERKFKQRRRRRSGGEALKHKVHIQQQRLKHKPVRIRKEALSKRPYDRS